jgi:hypothetical protein
MATLAGAARKTSLSISIAGNDLTEKINASLINFSSRESISDYQTADSLSFTLADPEGFWRKSKPISEGDSVEASITQTNWSGPGSGNQIKKLSGMYVQRLTTEGSKSHGTTIKVQCTSINPNSSIRLEYKSDNYPDVAGSDDATETDLKTIVEQIAKKDGYKVSYLAKINPKIQRADQHNYSDLELIRNICRQNDLTFKIVDGTIFVRDWVSMEQSDVLGTFVCPTADSPGGLNDAGLVEWQHHQSIEDLYSECQWNYTDPTSGQDPNGKATDPSLQGLPKLVKQDRVYADGTRYQHITMGEPTD